MRVFRLFAATNDVEALTKKHRDIWVAARQFERVLTHGLLTREHHIPGLGLTRHDQPALISKARVLYPPLGGKSSGLRYVYERFRLNSAEYAVVLSVYVHQGGKSEQDNRALLRQRFLSYEATADGLRNLDNSDTDSYLD